MSRRNVYDNWEKLVDAVLKREKDDLLTRCDSITSTSSPRFNVGSFDSTGLWPFQFSEIKKATGNFRPHAVIGEMTFPCHFRGWFEEDTLSDAKIGTGICLVVELNPCSMLDQKEWLEFNAKLSGFVLGGSFRGATQVSTLTSVSVGYVAPEYLITGHLTTQCNVYSLGVVLLELLVGCRVIENNRPAKEQNLVDWAKPFLLDKRKFLRIMDRRLEDHYPGKQAYAVGKVVFKCLNSKPELRPPMSEVLFALEHL